VRVRLDHAPIVLALCAQCGVEFSSFKISKPRRKCDECLRSNGRRAVRDWGKKNRIGVTHVGDSGTCQHCSGSFIRRSGTQLYCSPSCNAASRSLRRRDGLPKRLPNPAGGQHVPRATCKVCGGLFYAAPVRKRRGHGVYCSTGCRGVAMARRPESWPQTKHRRGIGGRRPDLGGLYLRSRWEANWARYLNLLVQQRVIVGWEYEPCVFEFSAIKRGSRTYTPDFRVTYPDGTVIYQELKGWMDPKSATKLARMSRYYPDVKLEVIGKKEYTRMSTIVGCGLPGWEEAK
jgi:hypothetical protein